MLSRVGQSMLRALILSIVPLLAIGCGGGGGGPGGSRGVRLLHASIDAAPFRLFTSESGGEVLQMTRFAEVSAYTAVPEGEQVLAATSAENDTTRFAFSVDSRSDERRSILLFGQRQAVLLLDEPPEAGRGMSVLRIVNGVDGAAVNVQIGAAAFSGVAPGAASQYIEVEAGDLRLTAVDAGNGAVLLTGAYALEAGQAYTILLAGEAGYFVAGPLLAD